MTEDNSFYRFEAIKLLLAVLGRDFVIDDVIHDAEKIVKYLNS